MTVPGANINAVKTEIGQVLPSVRVITAKDLLVRRQSQVDQINFFTDRRIAGAFIGGIVLLTPCKSSWHRRQIENRHAQKQPATGGLTYIRYLGWSAITWSLWRICRNSCWRRR